MSRPTIIVPSPKGAVWLCVIGLRSFVHCPHLADSKPASLAAMATTAGPFVFSLAMMSLGAPLNPLKRAQKQPGLAEQVRSVPGAMSRPTIFCPAPKVPEGPAGVGLGAGGRVAVGADGAVGGTITGGVAGGAIT